MTTVTVKNLGEGTLGSSKATIYTVPAVTSAIVASISLVNKDSVAKDCKSIL